jgi:hypothetical protein
MTQLPNPPSPLSTEPLLTEAAVIDRIAGLLGSFGVVDRTMWILFLDADRVQLPMLMPIDDFPEQPDEPLIAGLMQVFQDQERREGGGVVLALERPGPGPSTADDRRWAEALDSAARSFGVTLHGIYLAAAGQVTRLTDRQ